ncbi:hypothetical protein ACLKA6_011238 [Drosophila palustris]
MRWLLSLVCVGLATLVLAEEQNIAVRRALVLPRAQGPLIKLAVQPAIASEPVVLAGTSEVVAPVAAAQPILPYVGAPQYWPGYGGPRSWYGWDRPAPAPFWGGYRQRNWRSFGGPYWRPRVVQPVEASTEAAVVDTQTKVDTDAAVEVAVDAGLNAGLDSGVNAAVVADIV